MNPTKSLAAESNELRNEILTEFRQVLRLAPADYTENCTNVVMSIITAHLDAKYDEVRKAIGRDTQTFQNDTGLSDFAEGDLGIALADLRNWLSAGQEVG